MQPAAVNTDRSHTHLQSITYTRNFAIFDGPPGHLETSRNSPTVPMIAASVVDTMQHTNFEGLRRTGPSLSTSILLNTQKYFLFEITAVFSLFREESS